MTPRENIGDTGNRNSPNIGYSLGNQNSPNIGLSLGNQISPSIQNSRVPILNLKGINYQEQDLKIASFGETEQNNEPEFTETDPII